MPAVVRECKCDHEYQDKKYGSHKRVHCVMREPYTIGEDKKTQYVDCRCSVCSDVKKQIKL